ncbi:MAG: amino acid adenylation domain-containing protein [Candidatus Aminicenantes bacterium]|nr:MAG: amino acid adenylation domain-containing protein [Candidatus Aminicenantes bacterium]
MAANQNKKEREYWLNKLSGDWVKTSFPFDFEQGEGEKDMGEEPCEFSKELSAKAVKLSGGADVRLQMVLAAALVTLLNKYTGSSDIIIGSPILKQEVEADFINRTLIFRNPVREGMTFKELLLQVKNTIIEAAEHQNFPMEVLLHLLNIPEVPGTGFPLFDTVLVLENIHDKQYLENVDYNVLFSFNRKADCIEGTVEYNPRYYRAKTIRRIIGHFIRLLEKALQDVNLPLSRAKILSEQERTQLLDTFNGKEMDIPQDKTLHGLFEEQAARTPDYVALIGQITKGKAAFGGNVSITYKELNEKSNQLAQLLGSKGVGPDTFVGLLAEPSVEMMIGVLGILKSGGAYLPIDPDSPLERINFILADSGAKVLITTSTLAEESEKVRMWEGEKILIGGELQSTESPGKSSLHRGARDRRKGRGGSNLAYVIYTSGTTGKPKGVLVEHGNGVTYIYAFLNEFEITPQDTVIQLAAYTFDVFIEEVFPVLFKGGKIAIPPTRGIIDIEVITEFITCHQVTLMDCTPLLLNEFNKLNPGDLGSIHTFISGGDVLKKEYVDQLLKIGNLYNTYGPTETTVCATYYRYAPGTVESNIPIGKPIPNYRVYILDKSSELLPIGVAGELCISGEGVTRGYLNRPELTAEKFDHDGYNRSYRSYKSYIIYKTGDLARWLGDGNIEFLGRMDSQVKVRGFRIELGEIESRLLIHDLIQKTLVIDREDENGEKYLCAYIVSEEAVDLSEVKDFLSKSLPYYMVPSYFMFIDRIPLTPNGKVDRKTLPAPEVAAGVEYAAPGNDVEEKLVEIWSKVLHIDKDKIGIHTNFFEVGGHSLRATVLMTKIHKEFGIKVPMAEIFKTPTIRGLSSYINTTAVPKKQHDSIETAEKKEYYPLSSTQSRFYILQRVTPESTAYNMAAIHQLEGHVEKEKFEEALNALIKRHETLRTSFQLIDSQPGPIQRIHEKVEFKIDYYSATEDTGEARTTIKNFIRPFDLSQPPLLRLGLIKLAEEKHILMFDMHHIICDGISMILFLREFITLYPGGELRPQALQYRDFARWQYNRLTSGKLKKSKAHWLKRFSQKMPVVNMPTDFPRPAIQSFEGDRFHFPLESSLTGHLNQLIKETGTTLFMVLLAVYNILLSRYTGQEEIVIGTTIAGRPHSDLENIIGLLIETLALRNYPAGDRRFSEFLKEVKQRTLEDFDNQDYPFKELIKQVGGENEISRNPVFDVMLMVQILESPNFELEGLRFSPYEFLKGEKQHMSKVDLTIEAIESREEMIYFVLEYCTRLYKRETIERLARHFVNIIREVVKAPEIKLSAIQVISEKEKKQLAEELNDTDLEYTRTKMAHELFEEQAERTPDHIALVGQIPKGVAPPAYKESQITNKAVSFGQVLNAFGGMHLTYRELNKASDQLAYMLKEKGVQPDTIVGIMVEPSIEMVIGLLGILKSGGAYLPIEPDYPEERVNYMLEDSGAKILLTAPLTQVQISSSTSIATSTCQVSSANLAYVIYTSGTTGRPKGVLVEHQNLTAYINAFENEFDPGEDDVVIQQVSYAFDAFVEELYPILLKGGKLAIPGSEVIRDISALCDFIAKHRATFITCSPQLLNELNNFPDQLVSLRILISGGDRLKAEYIGNLMRVGKVYNTYGPTESTVCATYYRCLKSVDLPSNVPIGKPISNYKLYILDKYMNVLPVGVGGELCVAGKGVTRGYLNRPELTSEKFCLRRPGGESIAQSAERTAFGAKHAAFLGSPRRGAPGPRKNFLLKVSYLSYMSHMSYIYKTGDLTRWLSDGNIEFLGRIDRQVKIRGYRIELGEIENQLVTLESIKEAAVVEGERKSGQNYLAAYVVVNPEVPLEAAEVKSRLAQQLPDYMIPPYIMEVEEIPLTLLGKVDRKQLPSPDAPSDRPYAAPESDKEKIVAEIWKEVLEKDPVGLDDNFFDLGGTSLDIFKVNTRMNEIFQKQIPVVNMYQHSTIRSLVRFLQEEGDEKGISEEKQKELVNAIARGKDKLKKVIKKESVRTGIEIAVIGMACVFPGAPNIAEFWENLKNGIETISFFTDEEMEAEGLDAQILENPNYIKARGIIPGVEYFDSTFFGYAPIEAQIMDPQMRVFTQCIWHALEDAGYDPFGYNRRIGLYAGASPNLQWETFTAFSTVSQGFSGFMTAQLADKDFMCTHISYKLNLKGPSVSLHTACSTSLVAIHWAVQGLLHGECEMALAGGVSISYPSKRGYHYQPGMIYSADGHNRTFDAKASGSIFGDGVGVVVLKNLEDALADRDHIYAVIKGSAINNDGYRKVGYTAPSVDGQAEVIKAAQLMAEVEPESITFIEAHGTATQLGDTVEIEALKQVFNSDKKKYCAIGTVKSNFGHLYSAAGAAGFIKTVLALKHRLIPPSLHFKNPNPEIDFENSPFYVVTEPKEWKTDGYLLRAGVSSFGIGGTNAHVVLEEFLEGTRGLAPLPDAHPSRNYQLILLSAKTPTALEKQTGNLVEFLKKNPGINLADMAYMLQVGRKHFPYRRMAVGSTLKGDLDRLALYMKRVPAARAREENRPIIFMFCGQGSQYVNMGIDLYRSEPIFQEEMDRCFEILKPLMGYDIKEILYPSFISNKSNRSYRSNINQTQFTQPVVFSFEYALAKLLIRWGIKPRAMIGYSFGEYIAACIAGVFSLQDALKLVIMRGKLTQQSPIGAMTSVPLPEKELKPLLNKDLSLAIVNGPTCIVSGAKEVVEAFEQEMKKKRILCVPLNMSQAIHSSLMEPIRDQLENRIKEFRLNEPQIPYISNVSAQWITGEEAAAPGYWGEHLCSTVRFSDGLKELLKQDNAIFIEIGAGRILGMMVRTHPDKKPGHMVLNTVKHQQEKVTDDYFLLDKVGQLWLQGQRIDWEAFHGNEKRYRLSLPGYPFEGKRYWLEPNINPFQVGSGIGTGVSASSEPLPGFEALEIPDENYKAPRNELEQRILQMWQEYMGVEKVGIHDDFFYLNGNSLIATQLMARLTEEYQVQIPAHRFYEKPTIAHLAEVIKELVKNK